MIIRYGKTPYMLSGGLLLVALLLLQGCDDAAQTVSASASDIQWMDDPEEAFAQAELQDKPVVIYFHAQWCGFCEQMEESTFADQQVVERLNNSIALKIDTDERPDIAQAYNVTGLPTTVIADAAGNTLEVRPGYMNARNYLTLLP